MAFFQVYLFIYFWLRWVFVSVRGLSLVAASGIHSSSRCAGLWLSRPLLLWSTGSRRAGSVVVAHGPSCSAACGIFPDQGSNPCPVHWQADSQPLRHQGSPPTYSSFTFSSSLLISKLKIVLVGCVHIKKWNKNSWVIFVLCFHCSGKDEIYVHIWATIYEICNFGNSAWITCSYICI